MNSLIIIGASGHGKVVADIARLNGYDDIAFLDDAPSLVKPLGYPILGKVSAFLDHLDSDFIVAIGNSDARRRIQNELNGAGAELATLIHPSAVVAHDAVICPGSVVMATAVLNPSSRVGTGCIINTGATVDHDCLIGDFVHVSVGAHLAGAVSIGDATWIGIGASVSNNISICSGCMIGAGAVVIRDIDKPGTYVGVPAHLQS